MSTLEGIMLDNVPLALFPVEREKDSVLKHPWTLPAIVSLAFLGVLFLALCVGIIMFKYGRRKNSAETRPSVAKEAGVKTGENQYYGCQNGDYEYEMVNRDNDYYAR